LLDWTNGDVNEPLQVTLADAVELLERHRAPYALIGGLAASLRGQPRVTADVDLVMAVDVEAALSIAATLGSSRFAPLFPDVKEVVERALILPVRHRITGVKVDVAIGLSGFERQAVDRAQPIVLAGREVAVATAEDIVIMKLLAGRPQDELDLKGIVAAQADRLDWSYCQAVAAELGEAIGQDLISSLTRLRKQA
jgi:hypothetical protein